MKNKPEEISIHGVKYHIFVEITRDEMSKDKPALARQMKESKATRQLYVKRPRGKIIYLCYQFENGNYSVVMPNFRI